MSVGHLYVLFGEVSIQVGPLYIFKLDIFVCVGLHKFFINLGINHLSFVNMFSHSMGCLFTVLMVSFAV